MTQTVLALVLLVVTFTVVYYGLLSSRTRHGGIWVTDEVAHLLRFPDREWHRDDMRAVSWVPIPVVRRCLDRYPDAALEAAIQARRWPGFGLVLEVTPSYNAVRAFIDGMTSFYREVGRVAVETAKTVRETMDRIYTFAKANGIT